MAYNPYSAVNAIYKLKGQWANADNAGDTAAKNDAAAKAQAYYNQLRSNGYGDVADELTASNYTQAKAINDKWANVSDTVTGTFKSGVDNPAYNQSMTAASKKNDDYFETVKSDHSNVNSKYNDIFNYANSDVTKSDEYKSSFKNIMPSYTLAAMQGRDNEAASGAASNGGNVDSFAAANAMRQQAALTAKGQQLAHQAGVEAYQARIQNARNILSDLGVYNSSVYSAMSDSVNNDRAIANDIFNNEQTSLNNDVARKSEIASVTGYIPAEWSIQNDAFLKNFVDENGKLKAEYNDIDFQELANNAKASGNTELAKKYAILRGLKIFGNFSEYGKYLNEGDISYIQPQRTADYDLTRRQIESAENIAKGENSTSLALADKEAASALAQINASSKNQGSDSSSDSSNEYTAYNTFLSMWPVDETRKRAFIERFIKPIYEGKETITPEGLKQLILYNTKEYNIDVDDAQKICQVFGVSTDWLNQYRDRTDKDGAVSEDIAGRHGGMVKKE